MQDRDAAVAKVLQVWANSLLEEELVTTKFEISIDENGYNLIFSGVPRERAALGRVIDGFHSKAVGSCGHNLPLSDDFSSTYHAIYCKDHTEEGLRAISYKLLCAECYQEHLEEGLLFTTRWEAYGWMLRDPERRGSAATRIGF